MDKSQFEKLQTELRNVLQLLGEDVDREGLQRTPLRVAKCLEQFVSGYEIEPKDILLSALFHEQYDKAVAVRDIDFYSLCEHHMLPFFGKVHVAYIPDGQIVGLSKIPRVVEVFARRLQVQERMTRQIRQCIDEAIHPRGVMVVVEAQHLCMQMRGVEKQGTKTITMDYSGDYESEVLRQEFLQSLNR